MQLLTKVMIACLSVFSLPALAADGKKVELERPALFTDLVNCRTIANSEERLACFDAKVAALDEAQQKQDIVVTDRETVKEARRGLFGFNLPKIKIFGENDNAEDIDEISSTITSVSTQGGKWLIVLEDGAKWLQVDSEQLVTYPKPGMPVVLKKAALGSFLVNIRGQRAIRMRRLN